MSTQSRRSPAPGFSGLSLSLALVLVLAASVTGLLLSVLFNGLGWPFLLCFLLAAVFVTLFVEAESLFLTVAPLPLIFGFFAFSTSWGNNIASAPDGAKAASRTMVWTSIYAVVEYFPALALITVISIGIAVARLLLLNSQAKIHERNRRQQRSRNQESNRRNIRSSSRARERTNRVTVEELMARNRADNATSSPVRSSRLPRSTRPSSQLEANARRAQASAHASKSANEPTASTERIRPAAPTRTSARRAGERSSAFSRSNNRDN
ncbi:hypothetical protein QPX28_07065 [Corynebacterium pseudodiphtheriticum]|uniref:DUF6542 domain-containing protein n=1 Tax=Corynebacterium pseudodiphtheriticum TaxID=37637 RepID=UPI002542F37F|nr:DUF6542 domain-containing protein [Corynebacterium pseudodiphtheriticum]MDK4250118.1 hypothetical protein [Corynebacterium pseudodiphtheriticum]